MKKLTWVVALLLIASSSAVAQERKRVGVSRTGESVLMVLERERCDPLWLSQVLIENGLNGTTGREILPEKTELFLTYLSCKLPAPKHVAQASARLSARVRSKAVPKKETVPPIVVIPEVQQLQAEALKPPPVQIEPPAPSESKISSFSQMRIPLWVPWRPVSLTLLALFAILLHRQSRKRKERKLANIPSLTIQDKE